MNSFFHRFPNKAKVYFQNGMGWFPLPISGILLFLGFYVSYTYYGIVEKDYFLNVIGFAGLCIGIVCILFSLNIGFFLWWQLKKIEPMEGTLLLEGQSRRSLFRLPLFWWVPFLDVRWMLTDFGLFCDGNEEVLTPLKRGEWDILERKFIIRDIFGFTSISFSMSQNCELQVLPDKGGFDKPLSVKSLLSGSDISHPIGNPIGDRMDIRNYVQGDPIRYILWKTYARTGQLVVRTPERALQPSPKMQAYLVVGEGDSPAAGILWALVESNLLGKEWEVAGDGFTTGITEIDDAKNMIIASANSKETQAESLQSYLQNTKQTFEKPRLLLFVPPIDKGWVDRLMDLQLSSHATVVICVDGIEKTDRWNKTLHDSQYTKELEQGITTSQNIHRISTTLKQAGIEVLIADRQIGNVLTYDIFQHIFVHRDTKSIWKNKTSTQREVS